MLKVIHSLLFNTYVLTQISSSWLGSVVSRRKFLKSVIKNSNTKNSTTLSRSCDLNLFYPPLSDEVFRDRLSGILFGWFYRSDQVYSFLKKIIGMVYPS